MMRCSPSSSRRARARPRQRWTTQRPRKRKTAALTGSATCRTAFRWRSIRAYVGKKVRVLVDGRDKDMLTARTEGGRLVRFAGDDSLIGQFMDVKITGCTTWSLIGEI